MKIGVADFGFNVWDGNLYDIEERLLKLKSLGFQGIERLEAVSPSDAIKKAGIYHRLQMDFGTCRGASVQTGIEWTCALGKKYIWLTPGDMSRETPAEVFYRRANIMVDVCAKFGLKAGLHNHLNLVVESPAELDDFLKKVPGAYLLLDTAHLAVCGGDPVEFIRKYSNRLCAIHFKDAVKTDDGYLARPLGLGDLGIDHCIIMEELLRVGYDEWVFIEPEDNSLSPYEEVSIGMKLLKDGGFQL